MSELIGYYLTNNRAGLESLHRYYKYLHRLIPSCLEIKEDGSLIENSSREEINLLAKLIKKDFIIPLVQNYQLNSGISNKLVNKPISQEKAINNLIIYLKNYGFLGINIDIEGVRIENKGKYMDFIEKIAKVFHNCGYRLSLSIPAKSENNKDSSWSGAYDYKLLGKIVDEIVIMAYDYHWIGGSPGPIAPLFWVKDVIDFAMIEIPLSKIYLGIPFYGYNWVINSECRAKGLSYLEITKLAKKYNSQIKWDQESQSPYLKYEDQVGKHEVWFENRESLKKKLKLVKEFQLAGAAFWRLGLEDTGLWQSLNEVK